MRGTHGRGNYSQPPHRLGRYDAVAADLGIEAAATAEWADWFNNQLLHTAIGDIPPHEHETNHYVPQR